MLEAGQITIAPQLPDEEATLVQGESIVMPSVAPPKRAAVVKKGDKTVYVPAARSTGGKRKPARTIDIEKLAAQYRGITIDWVISNGGPPNSTQAQYMRAVGHLPEPGESPEATGEEQVAAIAKPYLARKKAKLSQEEILKYVQRCMKENKGRGLTQLQATRLSTAMKTGEFDEEPYKKLITPDGEVYGLPEHRPPARKLNDNDKATIAKLAVKHKGQDGHNSPASRDGDESAQDEPISMF